MTDLTKLPEPPKISDKEMKVIQCIGRANEMGLQLRDREIADRVELTIEDVRAAIGSLSAKGYIQGIPQNRRGHA